MLLWIWNRQFVTHGFVHREASFRQFEPRRQRNVFANVVRERSLAVERTIRRAEKHLPPHKLAVAIEPMTLPKPFKLKLTVSQNRWASFVPELCEFQWVWAEAAVWRENEKDAAGKLPGAKNCSNRERSSRVVPFISFYLLDFSLWRLKL